ncbi:hypothetical protein [Streptomyces sp. NPDC015350]|uniref:hypothetical protein n=1 Tax=Streptomyces sp. NPDC015350 TaxID=3364955 RepID=UPI0037008608
MQRRKLRTGLMLCAATALAAAAPVPASAAASPAAAPRPSARVVAVDCTWNPQVRPGEFLLACGDGNNRLIDIHWYSWGPTSAVGRGLDVVNDCQPYCAAGKFHSYPVVVRLEHPRTWQKQPELKQFTQLELVYTDGTPDRTGRVVTHQLWD